MNQNLYAPEELDPALMGMKSQARRPPVARAANRPAAQHETAAPAKKLAAKPKALSNKKGDGEEEWAEF